MHAARHADGPATVPEVPLQLAEDRGRGERRELEAPTRVEALDGLEQADQRDLDEVVALLAAIGEAAGEEVREWGVLLDELVPQTTVSRPPVAREAFVEALLAPVPMRPDPSGPVGSCSPAVRRSLVGCSPTCTISGTLASPA